jgi:riboflavin biosynthesis pyrimidine reductase
LLKLNKTTKNLAIPVNVGEMQTTKTITVVNVMASSIDGYVAVHDGQTDDERLKQGFTESEDREHLENLIKSADAIVLGSQTLIAGGGAIDIKKDDGSYPIWVTFTNKGIPSEEVFWTQTDIPRWLISRDPLEGDVVNVADESDAALSLESTGKQPPHDDTLKKPRNLVYSAADPVDFVLEALKAAGCNRVLLFGGGFINHLFYEAGAVDELILTLCPVLVGDENAVPLVNSRITEIQRFDLKSVEVKGNLIFLHYITKR